MENTHKWSRQKKALALSVVPTVNYRRTPRHTQRYFRVAACGFLAFIAALFILTARWAFTTWDNLTIEEIVYQLSAPLEGTGHNMLNSFFVQSLIPSIIIGGGIPVFFLILHQTRPTRMIVYRTDLILLLIIAITTLTGWRRLDIGEYIANYNTPSTFIEDHYVDPSTVTLTFPETKRNLIYIYLESMEDTYADTANGGGFQENCIPELTKLSLDNENFGGSSDKLNGATVLNGTTWTMGAMFAQTSGLPLKIAVGNNGMSNQTAFFPSITTLGDILAKEGYTQEFACGSNAVFGGRQLYFTTHGGYAIRDYTYAEETGFIPEGYKVWWGFEDEKLIELAKTEITTLASSGQPFNFTMLTADTHFPDGYVCPLCDTEFDDQYANVMHCSSKQIASLVEWIQQQDFYDNTTIVITGDHLTMDGDFCDDVSSDYTRKVYTVYINAGATVENPTAVREYSTLDDFPTTLASLGVTIEGNRLGLGTNLFSSEPTLIEQYGASELNVEFNRKSDFMDERSGISEESIRLAELIEDTDPKVEISWNDTFISFRISGVDDITPYLSHLRVALYNKAGNRVFLKGSVLQDDGTWLLTVYRTDMGEGTDFSYRILTSSDAGDIYIGGEKAFSVDD